MKHYSDEDLHLVHQSTALTPVDIKNAKLMGCFHCCVVFLPEKVQGFIDGPHHRWAHCPHCGIDSVITDKGTGSLDTHLLTELQKRSFS